jgi:putative alpha-1,2-mannosidase
MFMGTGDDYGQNDPAACVPYGMVKLCPDSNPPNHAGYNFEQPRISGISINRISGVGSNGKGGSLRIKPCTGDYTDEVRIIKDTEEAVPGFYATKLDNGNTFTIQCNNFSDKNIYIRSVSLNGEELDSLKISHRQIMAGGKLEFSMGNQPQK